MEPPSSIHPKSALRRHMRELLGSTPHDSSSVRDALETWLSAQPRLKTFAVFSALPGEVNLSPVVIRHPEKRWLYPLVTGDELTFHHIENPLQELHPGSFGILEPSADSPPVPIEEIDVFFCPGLAFDDTGGRLGRGRGFYDRILSSIRPDTLKIGICFPFQKVETTHSEPHDIPMDHVISG
ncbi:MAG: 5-formyltetrahydrofolate cyclo-ligase [Luteolibacter sp.]